MSAAGWRRYADKMNDFRVWALFAALLGGGGTAVLAPKVAPGLYRSDPAYGSEFRALRADVDRLEKRFSEFQREGPREVRMSLSNIERQLDSVLMELRRAPREGQH